MSLHEGADQARPDAPNRGGWATFEARVRARRVETCLERARELIDDGRLEEARAAKKMLLDLQPSFTISSLVSGSVTTPARLAMLADALREAGVPE